MASTRDDDSNDSGGNQQRAGGHHDDPPSPTGYAESAVRDAEQTVSDLWIDMLVVCRDQLAADMGTASACCGAARADLLAAGRIQQDPGAIADAHTALESALADADRAAHGYARAQDELTVALDRVAWLAAAHIVEDCINGYRGAQEPGAMPRVTRRRLVVSGISSRLGPWRARVVRRMIGRRSL